MTTITKRISGAISSAMTGRVFTTDATPDIPPVFSNDSWGGAWGNTWGKTWFFASPLIPGTDTKPSLDVTLRVEQKPEPSIVRRVPPFIEGEPDEGFFRHTVLIETDTGTWHGVTANVTGAILQIHWRALEGNIGGDLALAVDPDDTGSGEFFMIAPGALDEDFTKVPTRPVHDALGEIMDTGGMVGTYVVARGEKIHVQVTPNGSARGRLYIWTAN